MMEFCLVAMDTCLGVHPVGIGKTLCQSIAKLVVRLAGDQAKTVCGSLQLCAGLKAGIEGANHTLTQTRRERTVPQPGGQADKRS